MVGRMPENYWTLKVFVGLAASFPRLQIQKNISEPQGLHPRRRGGCPHLFDVWQA